MNPTFTTLWCGQDGVQEVGCTTSTPNRSKSRSNVATDAPGETMTAVRAESHDEICWHASVVDQGRSNTRGCVLRRKKAMRTIQLKPPDQGHGEPCQATPC